MNNAQKKYVEKHDGYKISMLLAKSSRGIVLEFDDKNALKTSTSRPANGTEGENTSMIWKTQ